MSPLATRASVALLVSCLAACGDDTTSTMPSPDLTMSAAVDGFAPDLATGPGVHLKIHFDYRFDKAGFFTASRKLALDEAAAIWGRLLVDDFPTVPAATPLLTRDPESPKTSLMVDDAAAIDDLLIFVGSSELPGTTLGSSHPTVGLSAVADPVLHDDLDLRFNGSVFQPWSAWISFDIAQPWFFDPTPADGSDVPMTEMDFVSVALHEIGHCLGIGSSPAFMNLVDTQNHTFIGSHAVAAYGGPVPLEADNIHFANDTMSAGELALLDPSRKAGVRYRPTKLDLAVLEDLGYHL